MRHEAKSRPHLTASNARQSRRNSTFQFLPRTLGFSSPAAVADIIRRKIIARENAAALQDPGVCHVKNGKPLTEYGAKLLGVEWPVK